MGTLDEYPGLTGEAALTCLPDKDLLWWAQGSFSHSVVHTHPDLITLVLAQIYGREWGSGTQVIEPREGALHGGWSYRLEGGGISTILVPYVALGRKQVRGKP